jgi:hypothetical protein
MPIYLVRWPNLDVSMVRARNEEALIETLHEISDPGACSWKVYQGPIWVDFRYPVELCTPDGEGPVDSRDCSVEGIERVADDPFCVEPFIEAAQTAEEMRGEIIRFAFPHVHRVLESWDGMQDVDQESLAEAFRRELEPLLQYRWRAGHGRRRTDLRSRAASNPGVTIPLSSMKNDDDPEGD